MGDTLYKDPLEADIGCTRRDLPDIEVPSMQVSNSTKNRVSKPGKNRRKARQRRACGERNKRRGLVLRKGEDSKKIKAAETGETPW